ncbi:MAG: glutaminase A [Puniceicoccaceae bacterium]|nr:MAG: glutaminase A [Puniceicoccaceae bacterium]
MNGPENIGRVVDEVYQEALKITEGDLASYIPELAVVDPELFGLSICDVEGNRINRGNTRHPFTIQSVSKVLSHICVLACQDDDTIAKRVGVEPTGEDFDSIIKLDRHRRPFNPMVNAGAIAVTDLLMSAHGDGALEKTLQLYARMLGCARVEIDETVFLSELRTGERNRAIAHLLNNFKLLDHPVEEVLQLYFKHCSVQVTTETLAHLGAVLARRGRAPTQDQALVEPDCVRKVMSVMLSCGMYNYAGQWIYEVGLPAKSGVSGCLLIVVPGRMGIGIYSPRVDVRGSSLRGVHAGRLLSERLGLHLLAG